MSGLKLPLTRELLEHLWGDQEYLRSIREKNRQTGLAMRWEDSEAGVLAEHDFLGRKALTLVVPLDDNENPRDGRLYLKDTFFYDAQKELFLRAQRRWELASPGEPNAAWNQRLAQYLGLPQPKDGEWKSFADPLILGHAHPLLSNPKFIDIFRAKAEVRDFLNQIVAAAREGSPAIQIKILAPETHFSVKREAGLWKVRFRWVLDTDSEPGNGRLLADDIFEINPGNGTLKSHQRNWLIPSPEAGGPLRPGEEELAQIQTLNRRTPLDPDTVAAFWRAVQPAVEENLSYGEYAESSGSFVTRPAFYQNLQKSDKYFLLQMATPTGTVDSNLNYLLAKDPESTFEWRQFDRREEFHLRFVVADRKNTAKNRIYCHDRFILKRDGQELLEHTRYYEADPQSFSDPELLKRLPQLNQDLQPSFQSARKFIASVGPGLRSGRQDHAEAVLDRITTSQSMDKPTQKPGVQQVGPGATEIQDQKRLQSSLELSFTLAQEILMGDVDASKAWYHSGPAQSTVEVQADLELLFKSVQSQAGRGDGGNILDILVSVPKEQLSPGAARIQGRLRGHQAFVELAAVLSESDAELRTADLYRFAEDGVLAGMKYPMTALAIGKTIQEAPVKPSRADELQNLLAGKGDLSPLKVELLGHQFIDHVLDEKMLLAMAGAGFIGSAFEYGGLLALGRWGRAGQLGATGLGIGGEALAFTAVHKSAQSFSENPEKVWSTFGTDTLSGMLLFGMFRFSHAGTGWLSGRLGRGAFSSRFVDTTRPAEEIFSRNLMGGVHPKSHPPLNAKGRHLIAGLNFIGGVESFYFSNQLTQWLGLHPHVEQGFLEGQIESLANFIPAMIGFRVADAATGGRLNIRLAEMKRYVQEYRETLKEKPKAEGETNKHPIEQDFEGKNEEPKKKPDVESANDGHRKKQEIESASGEPKEGRNVEGEVEEFEISEADIIEMSQELAPPATPPPPPTEPPASVRAGKATKRIQSEFEPEQPQGEFPTVPFRTIPGLTPGDFQNIVQSVFDRMRQSAQQHPHELQSNGQPLSKPVTFKANVGEVLNDANYREIDFDITYQVDAKSGEFVLSEAMRRNLRATRETYSDPKVQAVLQALIDSHQMSVSITAKPDVDPDGTLNRSIEESVNRFSGDEKYTEAKTIEATQVVANQSETLRLLQETLRDQEGNIAQLERQLSEQRQSAATEIEKVKSELGEARERLRQSLRERQEIQAKFNLEKEMTKTQEDELGQARDQIAMLEVQIEQGKRQVNSLEAKLKNVEMYFDQAQTEMTALREELARTESSLKVFQEKHQAQLEANQELLETNTSLQEYNAALDRQVQELNTELTEIGQEVAQLQGNRLRAEESLTRTQEALGELQRRLETAEEQRDSAHVRLENLAEARDRALKRIVEVETKLAEVSAQHREVAGELETAQEARAKLLEDFLATERQWTAAAKQVEKLEGELAEVRDGTLPQVQSRLDAERKQVRDLSARLEDLEQRESEWTGKVESYQEQLTESESKIKELNDSLSASRAAREKLQEEFNRTESDRKNLAVSFVVLQQQVETLNGEIAEWNRVHEQGGRELSRAREETARLEAELQVARETLDGKTGLEADLQTSRNEVARLEAALVQSDQKTAELVGEAEQRKKDLLHLKERLAEAEELLKNEQQKNTALSEQLGRNDALVSETEAELRARQEEITSLQEKISDLERKWSAGQEKVASLEVSLAEAQKLQAQIQLDFEASERQGRDAAAAVQGLETALTEQGERITELESRAVELESERDRVQRLLEARDTRLEQLEGEGGLLAQTRGEQARLEAREGELTRQLGEVKRQLESEQASRKELREQLANRNEEIRELQQSLEAKRNEILVYMESERALTEGNRELREKLEQQVLEIEKLSGDLQQFEGKLRATETELSDLQIQKDAELETLQHRAGAERQAANEAKREAAGFKAKLEAVQQELAMAQDRSSHLAESLRAEKEMAEALSLQVVDLETRLELSQDSSVTEPRDHGALEALRKELVRVQTERDRLQGEWDTARRMVQNLEQNLEALRKTVREGQGKSALTENSPVTLRRGPALSVGRHGASDIVIDEKIVSRHHLQLKWLQGQWTVRDLNSSQGTFLQRNGGVVSEYIPVQKSWVKIPEGALIVLGHASSNIKLRIAKTAAGERLVLLRDWVPVHPQETRAAAERHGDLFRNLKFFEQQNLLNLWVEARKNLKRELQSVPEIFDLVKLAERTLDQVQGVLAKGRVALEQRIAAEPGEFSQRALEQWGRLETALLAWHRSNHKTWERAGPEAAIAVGERYRVIWERLPEFRADKHPAFFAELYHNLRETHPELEQEFNPAELLRLPPGLRKKLYRRMSGEFHPDRKPQQESSFYAEAFKALNALWEIFQSVPAWEGPGAAAPGAGAAAPSGRGITLAQDRRYVGGRTPESEIYSDHPTVSPRHFEVFWGDGAWQVEVHSPNGLRVNETMHSQGSRVALQDGDWLFAGNGALARQVMEGFNGQLHLMEPVAVSIGPDQAVTLGRGSENTIFIPHRTVSSRHLRFENQNGTWLIQDSGSSNGTFLNGQELQRPNGGTGVWAGIPYGGNLRVGEQVFRVYPERDGTLTIMQDLPYQGKAHPDHGKRPNFNKQVEPAVLMAGNAKRIYLTAGQSAAGTFRSGGQNGLYELSVERDAERSGGETWGEISYDHRGWYLINYAEKADVWVRPQNGVPGRVTAHSRVYLEPGTQIRVSGKVFEFKLQD